jgi:hypothetical protein
MPRLMRDRFRFSVFGENKSFTPVYWGFRAISILMRVLKGFRPFPLSPSGGEGQGEGDSYFITMQPKIAIN